MRIIGCDCGKDTLSVCVLEEMPQDLKRFSRKYRPIKIVANADGKEALLALDGDIYIIEPTGNYSNLWINLLRTAEKTVFVVAPGRVKAMMKMYGILNKSDRIDAAAIAAYGMLNKDNPSAFIPPTQQQLRQMLHSRQALISRSARIKNQLGNRLASECPEAVSLIENNARLWGKESRGILLTIAGREHDERDRFVEKRQQVIDSSIGEGIKPYSQSLAEQCCEIQSEAAALELLIEDAIARPEYGSYTPIFERFKLPVILQATLLSIIYPFDRFLDGNGRRIIEYIPTKRDRSEGAFKLSCGMGKVQYQSGGVEYWKAGGSKMCRTAIWQYVKIIIVMQRHRRGATAEDKKIYRTVPKALGCERSPWLCEKTCQAIALHTETLPEVASLRLHYEWNEQKKGDQRVSATGGRFTRMLYKALLREFQSQA